MRRVDLNSVDRYRGLVLSLHASFIARELNLRMQWAYSYYDQRPSGAGIIVLGHLEAGTTHSS
jgi:hypothetical protein